MIVTYFKKEKTLTLNNEGLITTMSFDTQEQARKWLDDNGHFNMGLNLFI